MLLAILFLPTSAAALEYFSWIVLGSRLGSCLVLGYITQQKLGLSERGGGRKGGLTGNDEVSATGMARGLGSKSSSRSEAV